MHEHGQLAFPVGLGFFPVVFCLACRRPPPNRVILGGGAEGPWCTGNSCVPRASEERGQLPQPASGVGDPGLVPHPKSGGRNQRRRLPRAASPTALPHPASPGRRGRCSPGGLPEAEGQSRAGPGARGGQAALPGARCQERAEARGRCRAGGAFCPAPAARQVSVNSCWM